MARQLNWFNLKSLACLSISILFFALSRGHLTAFLSHEHKKPTFFFPHSIKYSILTLAELMQDR